MKKRIPNEIMVERENFAFFVYLDYENLPAFCDFCHIIGHDISNCSSQKKKKDFNENQVKQVHMPDKGTSVPVMNKKDSVSLKAASVPDKVNANSSNPVVPLVNLEADKVDKVVVDEVIDLPRIDIVPDRGLNQFDIPLEVIPEKDQAKIDHKMVEDDNESNETVYDESRTQLNENSDGDIPSLIEDSDNLVVLDSANFGQAESSVYASTGNNVPAADHVSDSPANGAVVAENLKDRSINVELPISDAGRVVSVQAHEVNDRVAKDISTLASTVWKDNVDKPGAEDDFSLVCSKSQKKNQKKVKKQAQKVESYNTRYRAGSDQSLDF